MTTHCSLGKITDPVTINGLPCLGINIYESIKAAIDSHPYRVALSFNGSEMTYSELEKAVALLAEDLKENGIGSGDSVVIFMQRSERMILSVLAVLKIGAVYVPVAPETPYKRANFIIEDVGAVAVLLDEQSSFSPDVLVKLFFLNSYNRLSIHPSSSSQNLQTENSIRAPGREREDLVYIIYTSGSTGKPKGVQISHSNLQNFSYWARITYGMTEFDVVDFSTSLAFDASVGSTIVPLICGACIQICPEATKQIPHKYLQYLHDNRISLIKPTPSYFSQLVNVAEERRLDLSSMKLILGGEPLRPSDIKAWFFLYPSHSVFNEYGPTEATVGTVSYQIESSDEHMDSASFPIGKPIYNTSLFILDENMNPCKPFDEGELWIGGESVGQGYRNLPDLTAKSFCKNPFDESEILYKTGDLVRQNSKGNLEFRGRIDRQVKIRGFRIELGEIEAILLKHRAIKNVCLVLKEIEGEMKLLAYLVCNKEESLPIFELRQYLGKWLPDYMTPSRFFFLAEMPLTINGKLDINALPLENTVGEKNKNIAAATYSEEYLLKTWRSVLNMSEFGVTDDFFLLGGDSLNAARIIYQVEKQYPITLSLQNFYACKNIRALASYIDKELAELVNQDGSFLDALAEIEAMSESEVRTKLDCSN